MADLQATESWDLQHPEPLLLTDHELALLISAVDGDADGVRTALALPAIAAGADDPLVEPVLQSLAARGLASIGDGEVRFDDRAIFVAVALVSATRQLSVRALDEQQSDVVTFLVGPDDWRVTLRRRPLGVWEVSALQPEVALEEVLTDVVRSLLEHGEVKAIVVGAAPVGHRPAAVLAGDRSEGVLRWREVQGDDEAGEVVTGDPDGFVDAVGAFVAAAAGEGAGG